MVKESYVTALSADDCHTVARVRNRLAADADDDTISDYAIQNDWVVFTADDDYLTEQIPHGLLMYEDEESPSPREVSVVIDRIARAYENHAAIVEWVPDGWI
jgi:predicted nuclease of predicted toxin-antitoxin system